MSELSNYQSAVIRITNAKTAEEVAEVEKGLDRVYNAGQLTTSELSSLCALAVHRLIEIVIEIDIENGVYEI